MGNLCFLVNNNTIALLALSLLVRYSCVVKFLQKHKADTVLSQKQERRIESEG